MAVMLQELKYASMAMQSLIVFTLFAVPAISHSRCGEDLQLIPVLATAPQIFALPGVHS